MAQNEDAVTTGSPFVYRPARQPLAWLSIALAALASPGCDGRITGVAGTSEAPEVPGGPSLPSDEIATLQFVRLSHLQWQNTVQALFGLAEPPALGASFDPDPPLGRFDNNSARLKVTSGLWQDYQRAAELMAETAVNDPAVRERIVPADLPQDPAEAGRAFVRAFGERAFRRPLTEPEEARYAALFAQGATHYDGLDATLAGVRMVVEAMLQSPHFVYRVELSPSGEPLTGFEIATRLSYAFWNTMPDDALLLAAKRGDLDTESGVRAQAARMIDDARARQTLSHFHAQLFEMNEYADVAKDPELFPEWRAELGALMQKESEAFLEGIIFDENGTFGDVLTAPIAFVNDELAPLYGVEGEFGADLARVELDPTQRAGLLTRLGFLTKNATLTEPDPIHRGVFINLNVLCRPLSAVPNLPDNLMPTGDTNRERITSITGKGTCGEGCHGSIINPIGFSLENYDAIGRYRTEDNGFPVNAADTYVFPDGRVLMFSDAVDLSNQLASVPEPHACYIGNLMEYLFGTEVPTSELSMLAELTERSQSGSASIRDMLVDIVASPAFRVRSTKEVGEGQ